jgi:hypothetical protein
MTLPHRLIIDGVEQCASDDAGEFLRLAHQYLGDMEQEFAETRPLPQWIKDAMERHGPSYKEEVDGGVPRDGWCHKGYPEDDE